MFVELLKAKYWALELLTSSNEGKIAPISASISSSKIDLNPHQIEAALFALKSPLSNGVILADEVGLGKTIEAGIVLSEYFSRGNTSLLVIAPANLCPQWQVELEEKFNLPTQILDSTTYNNFRKNAQDPMLFKGVSICSYNFATNFKATFKSYPWDLVVIDEAHKLRNLYKGKTKIATAIDKTFRWRKKLLLTATPIQNTLMDIFSLVSIIDPQILGNEYAFMENYLYSERRHNELKKRLECVLHRTLRRDVLEYIKYTNREAITIAFDPTKEEEDLYFLVSDYVKNKSNFAITTRFRVLIVLMIRKLMSSSTSAVKGTLKGLRARLADISSNNKVDILKFFSDEDVPQEYLDDFEDLEESPIEFIENVQAEIEYLDNLIALADKIKVDGKTEKLISSLEEGFAKNASKRANRKAIIFTESKRTLEYLFNYLSENGYKDKIVTFSGQNTSELCKGIYDEFLEKHTRELTGSKSIDMKKALVAKFKDDAEIMIATEAAAEGLNLQFCSILVNYDLPWNPQRIEQRIGRVHRYGQKNDVVIINFINKSNVADLRLYEILRHKFKLFDGVFGASDEILGTLSDGLDFEKAVASIFELCRTPEEINLAFDKLQASLGEKKEEKFEEIKQLMLDNLNPTIQEKFNILKKQVDTYLDRSQEIFWKLTKNILREFYPEFLINDEAKTFGQFESQVFNTPTDINFGANFSYKLDYTKRDFSFLTLNQKRALRLQAQAYNPHSSFGKEVLGKALSLETAKTHFVLKSTKELPTHTKGLGKITLCKSLKPTKTNYLIATFLNNFGNEVYISASDFIDAISSSDEFAPMPFEKILNALHDKKTADYFSTQKLSTQSALKEDIENLNRWLRDEKAAISLKKKSQQNKLLSLKRQFKAEKILKKKIAFSAKIKSLEAKINDLDLNSFDLERALEKQHKKIVSSKKRALKYASTIEDVFEFSFEVE